MYKVKSPILFLIFNRPEETEKVFNVIKLVRPSKLYIAADGPRPTKLDDIILCKKTRDIIKKVDWQCDIKTLFTEKNYGCKIAVSNSISWFFNNEPEGIILEDDCLPNQQFFEYCDVLLERYRYDTRIRHISGANLNDVGKKISNDTYYYSNLTNVWGWASWQRVWKDYDVKMTRLENFNNSMFLRNFFFNNSVSNFLYDQFKLTKLGYIDTWDYQYVFSNIINNGLSIIPNYNLISNIGFNKNATHTIDQKNRFANTFLEEYPKMIHPDIMIPNTSSDVNQLKNAMPSLYIRNKQKIKNFLKIAKKFVWNENTI